MKTFFNIYRCSYHLWGHFSGRDIFPLGIIFFLPERFLNVLCGVILLVIKMSTIFYAWKCLYFTFERCILWKRISKLLTATFFPLRSLRIFLLDSIISDEKSTFIFTFVPLYKTQLLSLTALNFSLKLCFFFFFLIWLWCSFLYFSCFLCLRLLDLWKYSFYQLWENFGYYFSLVFLQYILFCQTPKIHILGLLKLPNSSLRLCLVFIFIFCLFLLHVLWWLVSIAMSSNSLTLSFAISNILLIHVLYFLSQKL